MKIKFVTTTAQLETVSSNISCLYLLFRDESTNIPTKKLIRTHTYLWIKHFI